MFGCDYDDAFFREMADAFVSTGLRDAGYEYMLVQECIVPKGARDPVTHVVIPDATKFPHGLADLAAYFHSKGLKAGIYTDVAHLTCADYEGSGPGGDHGPAPGYWPIDALTYAQWGFDMIEADFCNTGGPNATYTGPLVQQLFNVKYRHRGGDGGDGPRRRAVPVQLGRRGAVGVGAGGREFVPQHGRHLRAGQHQLHQHPVQLRQHGQELEHAASPPGPSRDGRWRVECKYANPRPPAHPRD